MAQPSYLKQVSKLLALAGNRWNPRDSSKPAVGNDGRTSFAGQNEGYTMSDMYQPVALVTGANKGIGLEIARGLGASGLFVLVGARDRERGENAVAALVAEGFRARLIPIDIADAASIAKAADLIASYDVHLDILVNNAGIADPGDGPPSTASPDSVAHLLETNFIGALRVTQAMLPLLRKSKAGRIVNISSGLGSLHHNGNPDWEFAQVKFIGYNASKAALNMLTVQLAAELEDHNIKVNAAAPGFTATDINGQTGTQSVEEGAATAIRLALLPDDGPTGGFFSNDGREPW